MSDLRLKKVLLFPGVKLCLEIFLVFVLISAHYQFNALGNKTAEKIPPERHSIVAFLKKEIKVFGPGSCSLAFLISEFHLLGAKNKKILTSISELAGSLHNPWQQNP